MAQNKEQLDKLLMFIEQLVRESGNDSFVNGLRELVQKKFPVEQMVGAHSHLLDDIYEHCVEKVARKDAEAFYSKFCIPELVGQLTEDYVKMEHWRRRGNFEEFCLALYQQYEVIVNFFSKNKALENALYVLLKLSPYTNGKSYERVVSKYTLDDIIFYNKKLEEAKKSLSQQYAVDKFKSVLYLVAYGGRLQAREFTEFKEKSGLYNDLYQIRCKNHRGGLSTSYQESVYNRVESSSHFYSLRMLGDFADFVERINKNAPNNEKLIQYINQMVHKSNGESNGWQIKDERFFTDEEYTAVDNAVIVPS